MRTLPSQPSQLSPSTSRSTRLDVFQLTEAATSRSNTAVRRQTLSYIHSWQTNEHSQYDEPQPRVPFIIGITIYRNGLQRTVMG